ncbi:MAG: hypothetical protein AB1540_10015, partial [Bdellovibrionota bacterium]
FGFATRSETNFRGFDKMRPFEFIRRRPLYIVSIVGAILAVGATMQACNLFGGIDEASSREEKITKAQAQMDQDKCADAVKELESITDKNDDVYQMLGWAQLCTAGATIERVGKSLFSYSSDANNLSVVGRLANQMVPTDNAKVATIDAALSAFNNQTAGKDKSFNQAFGNIIKAAAVIAQSSTDNVKVVRADIAIGGCAGSTCDAVSASCDQRQMTDAQADSVFNAIADAEGAASRADIGVGNRLATNLRNLFPTGAGSNAKRCVVVNNLLSE